MEQKSESPLSSTRCLLLAAICQLKEALCILMVLSRLLF